MLKEWSAYLFKHIRSLNIILFCTKHPFFFPSAPPPSPSTFCSLSDDGNITLTCEIMEAGYDIDGNLLQYSWECPPTVQCHRGLSPSEAYVLKKSDLSQNVQCIVSNPLFRTSASISLSTCVPEGE